MATWQFILSILTAVAAVTTIIAFLINHGPRIVGKLDRRTIVFAGLTLVTSILNLIDVFVFRSGLQTYTGIAGAALGVFGIILSISMLVYRSIHGNS